MNLLLSSRRIVAVAFAFSTMMFSQETLAQSTSSTAPTETVSPSPSVPNTAKPKNEVETSVSIGSMAQLTATRILDTTTSITSESLAPSAGVFATFRQSFKPWLGYSVNLGYTDTTYRNTSSFFSTASSAGNTYRAFLFPHMYEISASYIAQKHLTNNLTVFGEAGGGTLVFAARNQVGFLTNRTNEYTPEGIAGFGLDYRLAHGLGLRAQYRGLFTRYPYPDNDPSSRLKTVVNEPTLSLTYTFGRRAHR